MIALGRIKALNFKKDLYRLVSWFKTISEADTPKLIISPISFNHFLLIQLTPLVSAALSGHCPSAGRMKTFSLSTKERWPVSNPLWLSSVDWNICSETQVGCGMQLLGLLLLLLGELPEVASSGAPRETKGSFSIPPCQFSLQERKDKSMELLSECPQP